MAKFFGAIGFTDAKEISPGVWNDTTEREYFGDILRDTRRLQSSDKVNDDISVSNKLSVVADPYAVKNFHSIIYVKWMGARWKVTSVEVQYPRLILELGGVYNGK